MKAGGEHALAGGLNALFCFLFSFLFFSGRGFSFSQYSFSSVECDVKVAQYVRIFLDAHVYKHPH